MGNVQYARSARPIGTRRDNGHGYIKIKTAQGWKFEHRVRMEQKLGRQLRSGEKVHHKNGDPADNREENLELWAGKKNHPTGVRQSDYHCPGCRCHEK